MILLEKTRNQLVSDSKNVKKERDGQTRYQKRLKSRIGSSVREYNSMNMNKLFKDNILDVNIQVYGETDNYIVTISFGGMLDNLKILLRNKDKVELRDIVRALVMSFNKDDVYIHCTCLHPDTKIKLLDGTSPTVLELKDRYDKGEKLYVYSVDENGDFKPGEVEKVWQTGISNNLIKIVLDNDQEIITTPDHLYLKRTGEYVQAKDLVINDSLMPLYFSKTKNDYDTIKINSTGRYNSIYKIVADYFKSNEFKEALGRVNPDDNMKYDVAIHHKDFNKHNNNPENLQILTAREHWDYHASLCGENRPVTDKMREASRQNAIKRNANPTQAMIDARKVWQQKGTARNYDEDRKKQQSELMRKVMQEYRDNLTEEEKFELSLKQSNMTKELWAKGCYNTDKFKQAAKQRGKNMHTPEREALVLEGVQNYWRNITPEEKEKRDSISRENVKKAIEKIRGTHFSEEHRKKMSLARLNESPEQKAEHNRKICYAKVRNCLLYLLNNNIELTEDNYDKYKGKEVAKLSKYFNSIDEAVKYFQINHKVKSIEYINVDNIPIYDIKVKNYHNFLVDAGVILHNCPDFKFRFNYWATKKDINSGSPENRPAVETNPNDDLGDGCKHVMLVLNNTSWIIKAASVINNYIKFMEKNQKRLYADIIYPAIYGKKYEEPVQMDLFNNDELETDEQTLDKSNKYARTKNQFKPGNEYRYPRQEREDTIPLDLEGEENARQENK